MSLPKLLVMSRSIERMARPPAEEFDIAVLDDHPDRDGWLQQNGAGFEAVLCAGMERLDATRLAMLPNLKLIAVVAAGMAGIDLVAAKERGITVTNAGDINAGDVAEFAVTMLLSHRREIMACDAYVRADKWPEARMPSGRSVSQERVGIVGLGHIGRAIADRLVPFGCEIAWWGPRPKPDAPWKRFDDLAELARWSTTLAIAARGDDSTRGLITAEAIDALGPDGLIVNVARGFVIDEPAMIAALKDGRLGGAALDVFDHEPIRGSEWADVPNVLMAPHVAGATQKALSGVLTAAVENIRRHFSGGELHNRVV